MNWSNILKANAANVRAAAEAIAKMAEAKQEERAYARRTHVQLSFDGVNISRDMQPYFMSLTYTDNEEDDADDLQIKLQDRDAIWLEKWLGSAIEAASTTRSYNTGSAAGSTANSYTVNAKSGLNVRSGPGSGYSKLGALPYGTSVNVTGTSGNWSIISYSGKTAYVFTTYLTKGGSGGSGSSNTASGFLINATIVKDNWKGDGKDAVLDCGSFELDSVQASGPPSTITLKATGLPFSASIRQTAKSKAWEKYNLSGIAKEMAANNGMSCLFLADYDPFYKRTEQYNVSDIAFLSRLCKNAGISLKCSNKILVLFDQSEFEQKASAFTITRGDGSYIKWDLKSGKADKQYQSCRVRYTSPTNGRSIEGVAYIDDYKDSKDNQQLEIRAKVSNSAEAKYLAKKYLRMHNKLARTATFTLPGNVSLVAGMTLNLKKWGAWSGKYIIKQAVHTVSSTGGYTTKITARHVLEGY